MTWVNGRIAASVGTADSYVSFPILYLFNVSSMNYNRL